jgi:four helix bundle protein
MYLFENLDVYKRAVKFATLVESTTRQFPTSTLYFRDRINMVANEIHQNLADAHSHWKDAEKKDFLWSARSSIEECSGLIEIAAKRGILDFQSRDTFRVNLHDLGKMVQTLIRGTESDAPENQIEQLTPHG